MKITRTEKIWLIAVVVFYVAYNLPFVPAYGNANATLIHAAITLIPLWIAVYVGLKKVNAIYQIRNNSSSVAENSVVENIVEKNTVVENTDKENSK